MQPETCQTLKLTSNMILLYKKIYITLYKSAKKYVKQKNKMFSVNSNRLTNTGQCNILYSIFILWK